MDGGWSIRTQMAIAFRPNAEPLARHALQERIDRLEAERMWAIQAFPHVHIQPKIDDRSSAPIVVEEAVLDIRPPISQLRHRLYGWLMHPMIQWDNLSDA